MEFGSHIEGSMFSHVYLLLLVRTYPINNEFCSKKKTKRKKQSLLGQVRQIIQMLSVYGNQRLSLQEPGLSSPKLI